MNEKNKLALKIFLEMKSDEIKEFLSQVVLFYLLLIFGVIIGGWVLIQYFWLPVYIYDWLGRPFLEKPVDQILQETYSLDSDNRMSSLPFMIYWFGSVLGFPFLLQWFHSNWKKANQLAKDQLKNKKRRKKK